MMAHPSIQEAISEAIALQRVRSGETMIPPPNYDIALCLYERNADETDMDEPMLTVSRPQDFATNPHMKYQRFGALQYYEKNGQGYVVCFLVHLYWDGSRDADSARALILRHPTMLSYGLWRPTAPSDPLLIDDFWDAEVLGEPPNGYWNDFIDSYESEESQDKNVADFTPFDNFARQPYERVD